MVGTDGKDSFADLFGGSSNDLFEQFFGRTSAPSQKAPTDPHREGLLRTFTLISDGNKSYLEEAVVTYSEEVRQKADDIALLEAHARSALFVDKLKEGYDTLRVISRPSSRQQQAMGIVAFGMENYAAAAKHFVRAGNGLEKPSRLAYSLSLLELGNNALSTHSQILDPLLPRSEPANAIMGYLFWKSSEREEPAELKAAELYTAEEFYRAAAGLSPNSERSRLDLMRVMMLNGKAPEVYACMNSFFVDTGSTKSVRELEKELDGRTPSVPMVNISNTYAVVSSLLGYKP
jgi:hypothetical protein